MKRDIEVFLEDESRKVGTLSFLSDRGRETAAFAYCEAWLDPANAEKFPIDPGLQLIAGFQHHKKKGHDHASVFHGCFSDSEPDGWGIRVINRMHAKLRMEAEKAGEPFSSEPLTSLDHLLYVDDACRIGALRYRDESGTFVRAAPANARTAPPLIELGTLLRASRAVEDGTDTAADLRYLLGRGTSLGGMRPKCSVLDDDGSLLIGKFPSATDTMAVPRAEALALRMAKMSGINAATCRVIEVDGSPVTLVKRFDRENGRRRMFVSARTLLGIDDGQEHAYTEIMDTLRQVGRSPQEDGRELWRRIAFTVLIRNVDDHLNNHGFLHVEKGQWRLSPAFDINPFPDKAPVLKTWISEDTGPEARIEHVLKAAPHFEVDHALAKEYLAAMLQVLGNWRRIAASRDIGMSAREMEPYEPAFEHPETKAADAFCKTAIPVAAPKKPAKKKPAQK